MSDVHGCTCCINGKTRPKKVSFFERVLAGAAARLLVDKFREATDWLPF